MENKLGNGHGNSETLDCWDEEMKLEEAMIHLRNGKEIYREGHEDKGYLKGSIEPEKIYGSFYMTIWDILAEDWEVSDD